jgi:Leucine-rich repeat (LRR) protein
LLNDNLIELVCAYNKLTHFPKLNDNLRRLSCSHNQLTSLPLLNDNLFELVCSNNILTLLPRLNDNLIELVCHNNIIYEILNTNDIPTVKEMLIILNKFKHLYYSLKYKQKFRQILWKQIREPKIMKEYHPHNLDLSEMFKNDI